MKWIGAPLLAFLAACGSAENLAQTAESPDGSMTAKFFVTSLGACCSMRSRVELTYKNGDAELVTEDVYHSSGGSPLRINWLDNWNLLVTDCGAAKIEMKSSIWTHKSSKNDHRRVHVVSAYAQNSSVNGVRYCEKHKMGDGWKR